MSEASHSDEQPAGPPSDDAPTESSGAGAAASSGPAEPPVADTPGAGPAGAEQPGGDQPAAEPRDTAQPTAAQPTAEQPAAAPPGAEQPEATQPAAAASSPRPVPGPVPRPGPPRPRAGAGPAPAARPAAAEAAPSDPTAWGRVSDTGEVFVRTADGERQVGVFQAGSADEALAFYGRRFDDLTAEVRLLEVRLAEGTGDPADLAKTAEHLAELVPSAAAVGDLEGLAGRLAGVQASVAARADKQRAARAKTRARILERKEALASEAEALAESSTDWRGAGERIRVIAEEWKGLHGGDRKTEAALWRRFAAARSAFGRRRGAHFAELDTQREEAALVKRQLVEKAQALTGSDDPAVAGQFKALMGQWRKAGRGPRGVDDELWQQFRTAQDSYFDRRTAVSAEQEKELEANAEVKVGLLAEVERLDPRTEPEAASAALRSLQQRWEAAGKVPRGRIRELEGRMEAVEARFREVADERWRVASTESSPLVIRLRESVGKLESRLAKARETGNDRQAQEISASLDTQRQWLAQAERG